MTWTPPTEPGALVVQGNALSLPLPDGCVDLIITSPPYFALRSYRDGDEHYDGQIGSEPTPAAFLEALWAATAEMVRVLKPSGSIFVNLGDKYAGSGGHNNSELGTGNLGDDRMRSSGLTGGKRKIQAIHEAGDDVLAARRNAPDRYNQNSGGIPAKSLMGLPWRYAIGCIDQLGLILRAEVIWSKPNGLPESVTDRVRRSHEQWFHFVRSPRYFSAVDEVREAHAPWTLKAYEYEQKNHYNRKVNGDRVDKGDARDYAAVNPLGKLPGSVWTIPSEPLIIPQAVQQHYNLPDHFAAFPQEWPRRIILGWSPSGVCVECGEGRRPVVDVDKPEPRPVYQEQARKRAAPIGGGVGKVTLGANADEWNRRITGYACACVACPYCMKLRADCECDDSWPCGGCIDLPPTRPAVVLDPFAGTGTVSLVARALGRYGISVDLSHDYCRLAQWRIFESGHHAKSEQRMWAERQEGLEL